VDFALGTDTAGSIRVPASNCGLYGYRPSLGVVSVAGVLPFAPSFDTVGVLARDSETLLRAASVLLGVTPPTQPAVRTVHLLREAFALCDAEVIQALQAPLGQLRSRFGEHLRETPLHAITAEPKPRGLAVWYDEAYRGLQWTEIWSSLGGWIQSVKPPLGPVAAHNFDMVQQLDRRKVNRAICLRECYASRLAAFLGPGDLLCIPTVPTPAPLKETVGRRDQDATGYYPRALALTSLAGVGRLPQVSLPLAESSGAPVGLSLLARSGEDAFLLGVVQALAGRSG
jgi:amidase